MEGFLLESWLEENGPRIAGNRISDLALDASTRLRINLGHAVGCLQVDLRPGEIYCFISKQVHFKSAGRISSPFASALGEAIKNAVVCRVVKVAGDRILEWQLDTHRGPLWLIMELLPQSPNLFLLDCQRRVLSCLAEDRDRRRDLQISEEYRPIWPDRRVPLSVATALSCPADMPLAQWLVKQCSGMGSLLARELTCRCQSNPTAIEAAWQEFRHEAFSPRIYADRSLPPTDWREFNPWKELVVSPVRLFSQEGRMQVHCASVNEAIAIFADLAQRARSFTTQRNYAMARLHSQLLREERCVLAARQDLRQMSDPDQHRNCGTLLLANAPALQQQLPDANTDVRETLITVIDYHNPDLPNISIRVDMRKSAQENAQKYFRSYRKAKRGLAVQTSRISTLALAVESSTKRLRELEHAQDPKTLHRCLEQLPKMLQPPSFPNARRVSSEQRSARGVYLSADGLEILVGQSATHNEELTFKIARTQDLWLHAADYAGAHVIVRNPSRRDVPRRTIIEAAQLAAYFSGARGQSAADVRYTPCKHVQKVKGAAAGLVRLQRFNTVRVTPQKPSGKLARHLLSPPEKTTDS